MKKVLLFAALVALAVPVAAGAKGAPERGDDEKRTVVGAGLFVQVAEQVCKERLRPFLASDDARQATRHGNKRCARRLLRHEWKLARAVLVCTERLADSETLNRRTLSECLVSLLARRVGGETEKPKEEHDGKADEAKAYLAAVGACKEEAVDPGFADEHEGLSFVAFYGEGEENDERDAFKRCVKSKLE